MAFCCKCGQALHEGANFCGVCGAQVLAPAAPTAPAAPGFPPYVHPPVGAPAYVPAQGNNTMLVLLLLLGAGLFVVVPILAAIIVPNFIRARAQGQVTACKSNLKNIGTALEMWSTDNAGKFPESLNKLAPSYLKRIPTCPSCGDDTYSQGFQSYNAPPKPGQTYGDNAYTVVCTGKNHLGVGLSENFPQYTSTQGLISR